jgi:hypothetical protein
MPSRPYKSTLGKAMKLAWAIAFALLLSVCTVPMAVAGAKDGQGYFTIMASYIDDDELATREGKAQNRRVVLRILER